MATESATNKNSLEIICRIAPKKGNKEVCVAAIDDRYVKLIPPKSYVPRNNDALTQKVYKFSYVFDESDTQRDIFKRCAFDFVENLLTGNNSLLFTYGVTGSGKTHTMTGNAEGDNSGLLPRTLDVIFKSLPHIVDKCIFKPDGRHGFYIQNEEEALLERKALPAPQYTITNRLIETITTKSLSHSLCCAVFVSYIEIYNDLCYDLLDETLTDERLFTSKLIRQDPLTGQSYVEKIKEVEVQSSDEAIEQFLQAQERRRVAKTLLNKSSSRSHSVFNIRLVTAPLQKDKFYPITDLNGIHVAELSLVDLAGSERAKRTENTGDRLAESNKINQSLLTLRLCFERLRNNQRTRNDQPVPYRDSKLTHLFKSFFEGNGRIRMIICVNPQASDYEENLHVMKFAKLAREIKMAPAAAPAFPLEELNTLAFNRRDISRWNREFMNAVGSLEPSLIELYEKRPVFDIQGPRDKESLGKIRDYFCRRAADKENFLKTVRKNTDTVSDLIKNRMCFADLSAAQNSELQLELQELRTAYAQLNNTYTQMKRDNSSLRTALSKYEALEEIERRREEDAQRQERKKDEALAKQRRTLQQLEEVLSTPVLAGKSHVAQIREQFDSQALAEIPQKLKPRPRHRSKPPTTPMSAPRPTTTTFQSTPPSYINPRFHRRSRSAGNRVLEHQPANIVPTGTIMQPNFPSNTRRTTRPSTDDLKKCTDYVVTKQTADSYGNLVTELVKGKVIPTAGGGSAVTFNDVEVLRHESPAN